MTEETSVVTAWRIVSAHYAGSTFDGEGARRFGGRWNSKGIPTIYAAGTLSLAALEQLAHLGASALLEEQFTYFRLTFPDEILLTLEERVLPANWQNDLATTRLIGDGWVEAQDSLALKVPSAVVPEEHNFLINPRHPDARQLEIGPARPFVFDPRLVKTTEAESADSTHAEP